MKQRIRSYLCELREGVRLLPEVIRLAFSVEFWREYMRRSKISPSIMALLPTAYQSGPAFERWAKRYEEGWAAYPVTRRGWERMVCELLSLGIEPTVALAAFDSCAEALVGSPMNRGRRPPPT